MDGTTGMLCSPQSSGEPVWALPAVGVLLATHPAEEPGLIACFAVLLVAAGFLLFRHRDAVGDATNYSIRGMPVTARTPGCIVGFFAVVLMLIGAFLLVLFALGLVMD
ncbi:MAG: hypothetical protein R6X20_11010 [Phycisphaerae bacterium]